LGTRDLLWVGLVVTASAVVAAGLNPLRRPDRTPPTPVRLDPSVAEAAARVDRALHARQAAGGQRSAARAETGTVLRRLALGLAGTIPSLSELRRLDRTPEPDRPIRYALDLLADRRSSDSLAERFARAYVGTEGGPFLVYRRRRFVAWLSDRIAENRPYDALVRDLLTADGLWTDHPATNFLTVTYDPDKKALDPERLAGRVARAFLGVRLDCARCHDHPFAPWTRANFQGLAAFFGRAENSLTGIHEAGGEYRPDDPKTRIPVVVQPAVPYRPELLPAEGSGNRRQRLAAWLTDPRNSALPRATVNRVWAILFGRPLREPIDDLGESGPDSVALDLLADDFKGHGFDLRRLILVIASTDAFRLDSRPADPNDAPPESPGAVWETFPLTRLRPEQVAGAITQAASLRTIDGDSPVLVRLARAVDGNAFVKRFGEDGEDEFEPSGGTIPQRLLMLNGDLVRDKSKPDLFNAANRIAWFAPDDRSAVGVAYLSALSRSPTPEELRHFEADLAGTRGDERARRVSDLIWALVNSTEFSWNH